MQQREKLLAAVVGGLLLILVAYLGISRIASAYGERHARIKGLEGEIREKKAKEARGQKASAQLADWEHRSLPANHELARTLYQDWLVHLADRSKLKSVNVDAGRGATHRGAYFKLPFTVHARGTLDQAVRFMHDFYGGNHLHELREVSLNKIEKSSELDLNFIIEALILPGVERTDTLNDEKADRLAWASLKDYEVPIVKRNFFEEYKPPRPPEPPRIDRPTPPPPPKFDPSKFAVLTAILEVEGELEAWFDVRTAGQVLKFVAGDKLEIGQFKGKLIRINSDDVQIESDGKLRQLSLGKSLPQAIILGPATVPAVVPTTPVQAPTEATGGNGDPGADSPDTSTEANGQGH